MSNTLTIAGVPLDLGVDTVVLPTIQVSDLLDPSKIQSDFTPEFSVPGTSRNHAQLGNAAYDGNAARAPYKVKPFVSLHSDGVEILPRARMFVKGYEEGQYQLQLFAGNRRFVEALGDKTLRDLDFSRFNHRWTPANIAARAERPWWAANGWGYELFDRGRPLNLLALSSHELWPTLTWKLIWEQILADTGFQASDWDSALLNKLQLPAATAATRSEAFQDARRLRVGLGPGHEQTGNASQNRNTIERTIPFDDFTRDIGNVPPIVPTVAGIYNPVTYSYQPDETVYVSGEARCVVFLEVPYAKASAQVFFCVNGVEVVGGEKMTVNKDTRFSVSAQLSNYLLQPSDVLTAKVKLRGEDGLPILGTKWGFVIFRDSVFQIDGNSLPVDRFSVQVESALPPGGTVNLAEWLPAIKLLDFFKSMVQLGGLSVQCDGFEDYIYLTSSRRIVENASLARDWTAKRDAPTQPGGQARKVAYRYGSFAQKNHFRYTEDETVTEHYGDGVLLIEDEGLPAEYEMLRLPFAASEPSKAIPPLLHIAAYKVRENEDPFAEIEYDSVTAKPRIALGRSQTIRLVLIGGPDPGPDPGAVGSAERARYNAALVLFNTRRTVEVPTSYFISADEAVTLDAQAYVLPINWAGLQAMLTDCRFHTERYRLTARDIEDFRADTTRPVWDAVLQGYFSISKILEYSETRPVEVEMLRLHPSFLIAPTPPLAQDLEFFGGEYYAGQGREFY